MKIQSVRAFLAPAQTAVIRVESDTGLSGVGPGLVSEAALRAVRDKIAPFLEGRQLRDPDALRILFHQQAGVTREESRAYDAVEFALYDLTARALSVPVSDLLGGRVRNEVRLCRLVAAGAPEDSLGQLRTVKEADPESELMVDCRAWWNLPESAVHSAARALGQLPVAYLADPLPPADHAAWTRLKDLDEAPLAAGRYEVEAASIDDLIAVRCIDYLRLDLLHQGGYHTGRPLLASIARSGLSFVFATGGTPLEIVAAAHLAICWPEAVAPWLELPVDEPAGEGLLKEPLCLDDGVIHLDPKRPGLGVEVDPAVFSKQA